MVSRNLWYPHDIPTSAPRSTRTLFTCCCHRNWPLCARRNQVSTYPSAWLFGLPSDSWRSPIRAEFPDWQDPSDRWASARPSETVWIKIINYRSCIGTNKCGQSLPSSRCLVDGARCTKDPTVETGQHRWRTAASRQLECTKLLTFWTDSSVCASVTHCWRLRGSTVRYIWSVRWWPSSIWIWWSSWRAWRRTSILASTVKPGDCT